MVFAIICFSFINFISHHLIMFTNKPRVPCIREYHKNWRAKVLLCTLCLDTFQNQPTEYVPENKDRKLWYMIDDYLVMFTSLYIITLSNLRSLKYINYINNVNRSTGTINNTVPINNSSFMHKPKGAQHLTSIESRNENNNI